MSSPEPGLNAGLRILGVLVVSALFSSACGEAQTVGSGVDTSFDPEKQDCRLGEDCTSPTPDVTGSPAGGFLGGKSPTPPKKTTAPPPAKKQFFDIYMVHDAPFYFDVANSQPASEFGVAKGVFLRITNKDSGEGRPCRRMAELNGAFDTGQLSSNEVAEISPLAGGKYQFDEGGGPPNGCLTFGGGSITWAG